MITIEPLSTTFVPTQNSGAPTKPGAPSFALLAKGGLSSEARPFSPPHASVSNLSCPTKPGAPYLDSEIGASSQGRPPFTYTTSTLPPSPTPSLPTPPP